MATDSTYISLGELFLFFRKKSKTMNVGKRVSYTDILIQLPQIKSNNFVKHYQQSFQYENKIYPYTTGWTNILFV